MIELPWPDSEGVWWCSDGRAYIAELWRGKICVQWGDGDLHSADSYSASCEEAVRWVKCAERNPFPRK